MPVRIPVTETGLEASILEATRRAGAKAGKNLKINLGTNPKSIEALSQPLGRITGKADEFTKSMEAANARVLAFGASVGVLSAVTKGFKDLVTVTIEVEKQLTSINTIVGGTAAELSKFKKEIFDVARETEQSFDTVAEAALELSRQGLSAEDVLKRLGDSMILTRLSGLGAGEAVAGLTAAINSFTKAGVTSEEVLNKLSAAAVSAAVSERDLIEGIKRSGAVAVQAGVSLDELIGVISAVQQRTARGGSVIGNSFKTIFTRIQSLDKLETMQNLGVQVTDLQGDVLPAIQLIKNLAGALNALPEAKQLQIAEKLVGKFQIAPFLAILEDYNSEAQIAIEVTKVAQNATTEAYQRNVALNKTLSAAINEATINLKELANTLGEIGVTDSLKNILGFFNTLVSKIQDVMEGEGLGSDFARAIVKGISNVISGPGLAIFGAIIAKLTIDLAKFGTKALTTFFGMNSAAKQIATTQGAIASTLLSNQEIQKRILSIENSTLSVEQKRKAQMDFFTTALNAQYATMQKMQTIAGRIAPGVVKGTSGGGRGAGGFVPNFDAVRGYGPQRGMIPNFDAVRGYAQENADISRGVGGAPASARPVAIPNFNFGQGQRGTMIANTSEVMVPNYAGGGSAIFNRDMIGAAGMPRGARSITGASGYIPNFQRGLKKDQAGFEHSFRNASISNLDKTIANSKNAAAVAAAKAVKDKRQGKKAGVISFNAKDYGVAAMFAGKGSAVRSVNQQLDTLIKSGGEAALRASQLKKMGATAINYSGVQVQDLESMKNRKRGKINEPSNRRALSRFFLKPLQRYGNFMTDTIFDGNELAQIQNQNRKFVSGPDIFSSSVEGGLFEAAIRLVTKGAKASRAFKSHSDSQAAFDFEETSPPQQGFKDAFGFGRNLRRADAKRTADADSVRTLISKTLRTDDGFQAMKSAARRQGFKGAASGYIPNFASPLQDAIAREMSAGIPINQVRINQDGGLRNAGNPMGLAVTNIRDEPTGAIPRGAGGFVPNYNIGMGLRPPAAAAGGAGPQSLGARALDKSLKGLSASVRATGKGIVALGGSAGLGIEKLFALQIGMTALTGMTSEAESGMGKFAHGLSSALNAVVMTSFAMQGLQGFAKEGSAAAGVLGKLGVAAVGATVAFQVFKGLKSIFNEVTGVNKSANVQIALLADAAKDASLSLAGLTAVQQNELKEEAKEIFEARGGEGRFKFRGFQGDDEEIEQRFGEAIAFARQGGTGRAEINRLITEMFEITSGTRIIVDEFEGIIDASTVTNEVIERTLAKILDSGRDTAERIDRILSGVGERERGILGRPRPDQSTPTIFGLPVLSPQQIGGELQRRAVRDELKKELMLRAKIDDVTAEQKVREFEMAQVIAEKNNNLEKEANVRRMAANEAKQILDIEIKMAQIQVENKAAIKDVQDQRKIIMGLSDAEIANMREQKGLRDIEVAAHKNILSLIKDEVGNIEELTLEQREQQIVAQALAGLDRKQLQDKEAIKSVLINTIDLQGKEGDALRIAEALANGKLDAVFREMELRKRGLVDLEKERRENEQITRSIKERLEFAKLAAGGQRFETELGTRQRRTELGLQRERIQESTMRDAQKNRALAEIANELAELDLTDAKAQAIEKTTTSVEELISKIPSLESALRPLLNMLADPVQGGTGAQISEVGEGVRKAVAASGGVGAQFMSPIVQEVVGVGLSSEMKLAAAATAQETEETGKLTQAKEAETKATNDQRTTLAGVNKALISLRRNLIGATDAGSIVSAIRDEQKELRTGARGVTDISESGIEFDFAKQKILDQQFLAQTQAESNQLGRQLDFLDRMRDVKAAMLRGDINREEAARKILQIEKERLAVNSTLANRWKDTFDTSAAERQRQITNAWVSGAKQFADAIGNGLVDAIAKGESLGDSLRNAAASFADMMARAYMQQAANRIVGNVGGGMISGGGGGGGIGGGGILRGIGNFIGGLFQSGGMVRGGSGTKDDVPAVSTGGEFVMRRGAVSKYGAPFMEALNAGAVTGFQYGGRVQRGNNLFTPSKSRGSIVGSSNLLRFATQGFTSGASDVIVGGSGVAGIGLEAESVRLTNRGRMLGPRAERLRESKQTAFGLVGEQEGIMANYREKLLQQKLAKKEEKKRKKEQEAQEKYQRELEKFRRAEQRRQEKRSMWTSLAIIAGGALLGGGFGGYSSQVGAAYGGTANMTVAGSMADRSFANTGGGLFPRAAGGYVPRAAGVDTVPSMLSGGEFVMNAGATQRLGSANLNALNSGGGSLGGSPDIVAKLDELITVTSEGHGDINIVVNSDGGGQVQGGAAPEAAASAQRQLAESLKQAVVKEIENQKRLGGALRRR